jgi:glycosyltransferase involved in cell wall biosynthesis
MKILILNWRDRKNPKAGGAEVVTEEMASRWVAWGHEVTLFTAAFPGALPEEVINGVQIIRRGGQATVHWQAFRHYRKHWRGHFDVVIDEINTIPFLTPLYVKNGEKNFSYFNQLCREIWFYEAPVPKFLAIFGYLAEPLYLRPYRKIPSIVISESTKADLIELKIPNVSVFPMATDIVPVQHLEASPEQARLIFVGRQVPSKRVHDIIKAVALVKSIYPQVKLDIVGAGEAKYVSQLKQMVATLALSEQVTFRGRVSQDQKRTLMQQANAILVTSVREGWGLIVTEANALGTPGIVYNVPGLRDSVRDNQTGLITKANTPEALAATICEFLANPAKAARLREAGWKWSQELNWEQTALVALQYIGGNSKQALEHLDTALVEKKIEVAAE